MLKFTKLLAISALTASLFAVGCSDDNDTVTPAASKGSNPIASGNSHTYRVVQLDSGNVESAASVHTDSVFISGTSMTYAGQPNAFTETTLTAGIPTDTSYVSNDGNTSMRYMEPVSFNGLSPVVIPKRWVKEADFNSSVTEWTTLDTTLTNVPVTLGTTATTANVTIKQTRKRTGTKSISYGSTSKTAQATEITSTNNFTGTVKVGALDLPVSFNVVETLYFVENVGLVKEHRDYQILNLGPVAQGLPGFDITLQSEVIK